MHDQYQLPPPSSWEKFESLCRDIFALEWDDPTTKRHGRAGFPQHGVDVYGYTKDGKLHGIQCKKKDALVANSTAAKELREEVKKALEFSPKLSSFIFATTTPNDPDLEEVARIITMDNRRENLFSVHFLGWNDILEKLSSHDWLVEKYYKWALPSNDPNNYAFELWSEHFDCTCLFENACFLPFKSHQVSFRPGFIENLCSFHNQSEVLLNDQRTRGLNESLRHAIENFKKVACDLIGNATIDYSRPDAMHDVYTYWTDKGDLPYAQQREYVEYKKEVLKHLFYGLIVAANHIIDIKNKISKSDTPQHEYVRFRQSFDFSTSVDIPMYAERSVPDGILYPGLQWIKEVASSGMSDPVLEYEKAIADKNSERDKT